MSDNPFLRPSTLPAELPDFASIRDEHFEPAFEAGMAEQRTAAERIATDPAPPTFANTVEALEVSGPVLERVGAVFFTLASAHATPFVRELEARIAPRLAAHADAIRLDPRLFARIDAVWASRAELDPEQRQLVDRYRIEGALAGAALGEAERTRLAALNSRLAQLTTRFDADLVADTNDLAVHLVDAADLDGMADDQVSSAAAAAAARDLPGWLIPLVLPTRQPAIASLALPAVRRRLQGASLARGTRGGEHDTRATLLEIVRLRAERARLLGFAHHAALVAADETSGSTDAVQGLLERLVPAAARNAAREAAELGGDVDPADWAYLAEQRRTARFDLAESSLRPYLEVERVLQDGVFEAARRLYGVDFAERTDLVAHHPDVRVFEVRDEDGTRLGLYLLDLYTRDEKRGGAWMNSLVTRATVAGHHEAVVVNTLNVPKPEVGHATLLTLDSVETLFHEFGHALHGLFARARYPTLAGTNVPRDFVEFPSQVNEMWVLWPEVLASYARHVDTGDPLDAGVAERLRAARRDGEGFATTEYLAAAVLDQAWHRLTVEEAAAVTDVGAFERQALAVAGLDVPGVPPRYSSGYFAHIFAGGYSAAYYAYIWSEVLDADTVAWFEESGGLTRANGDRFRRLVLERGHTRPPLQSYREFRGRDAEVGPLLEGRVPLGGGVSRHR